MVPFRRLTLRSATGTAQRAVPTWGSAPAPGAVFRALAENLGPDCRTRGRVRLHPGRVRSPDCSAFTQIDMLAVIFIVLLLGLWVGAAHVGEVVDGGRDGALRRPRPRFSGRPECGESGVGRGLVPSPDAPLGDGDSATRYPYPSVLPGEE